MTEIARITSPAFLNINVSRYTHATMSSLELFLKGLLWVEVVYTIVREGGKKPVWGILIGVEASHVHRPNYCKAEA